MIMFRNCACRSLGMILFLALFLIVGVLITIWGWRTLQNARVSESWPTVSGEVTRSAIREEYDEDGTVYYADVVYEYVAADKRYSNDRVSFGEYGSSNRRHAIEIVERYPSGRIVTVAYDPDDPGTAVLEPGVTWSSYLILGIGLLFSIIPAVLILASLIKPNRF